jgi:hypothetical protein
MNKTDMTKQSGNNKKIAFLAVFILLVALFIVGYLVKDRQGGNKIIASGDLAPGFHLQTPGGRFVNLSDFRGKVVMVHFWATWCPPCVEEMPTLDKLYSALMGRCSGPFCAAKQAERSYAPGSRSPDSQSLWNI